MILTPQTKVSLFSLNHFVIFRFYFLGDDDLLEILGQSTNPTVIQSHLKKLFQGINSVQFDSDQKGILAMISLEGEVVPLKNPVRVIPEVEAWLRDLAKEMKITLRELLLQCMEGSSKGLDPGKYPSQVIQVCKSVKYGVLQASVSSQAVVSAVHPLTLLNSNF